MKGKFWFWIVFLIVGLILDTVSYSTRMTAIPMSTFDVYDEYVNNHQNLFPMVLGPLFVWLSSYFITSLFIK